MFGIEGENMNQAASYWEDKLLAAYGRGVTRSSSECRSFKGVVTDMIHAVHRDAMIHGAKTARVVKE